METKGGVTALMAAVLAQDRNATTALVEAGVAIDYPSRVTGASAMALAAKRGDAVMVHHLIDLSASTAMPFKYKKVGSAGAKASGEGFGDLFPGEDEAATRARHHVVPPVVAAASAGQLMTIDVLVEETERLGGPESVSRLVDQNFGPDNLTALHVAVRRRDLRTAIHLVKKGARTDLGDARGVSPGELLCGNQNIQDTFNFI